jgi:hypothetical protein
MAQHVNSIKVVPQITQKSNLKQFHLYVNYQNDFKKLIVSLWPECPKAANNQPTWAPRQSVKCLRDKESMSKNFFWHKFTYSFCELYIFITLQQILLMFIKAYKKVWVKFCQNSFMRSSPAGLNLLRSIYTSDFRLRFWKKLIHLGVQVYIF